MKITINIDDKHLVRIANSLNCTVDEVQSKLETQLINTVKSYISSQLIEEAKANVDLTQLDTDVSKV